MRRDGTVTVLSRDADKRDRFPVFVGGFLEQWSIDQIREHVADGGDLTEQESAA